MLFTASTLRQLVAVDPASATSLTLAAAVIIHDEPSAGDRRLRNLLGQCFVAGDLTVEDDSVQVSLTTPIADGRYAVFVAGNLQGLLEQAWVTGQNEAGFRVRVRGADGAPLAGAVFVLLVSPTSLS